METKVKAWYDALKKGCPLTARDRILLACSGGVDSVLLLHWMKAYQEEVGFHLEVFHLHHGLRAASDQEFDFVRQLVESLKLQFHGVKVDTNAYAEREKMSIEMAARELRYGAIKEVMEKQKLTLLALGHNKNDNAETFFLNLFRGAGSDGLSGMRLREGALLRPLLSMTRKAIEEAAASMKLEHVEDLTNHEPIYARNRIRLELIPAIERDFDPAILRHVERSMQLLQAESDLLDSMIPLGVEEREYQVADLQAMPEALLRRWIRKLLKAHVGLEDVNFYQQEALFKLIQGKIRGEVELKGQFFAVEQDLFLLQEEKEIEDVRLDLQLGKNHCQGYVIELSEEKDCDGLIIDRAELKGRLMLRRREAGDRMRVGPTQTRLLKKVLIDDRIPRSKRGELLLLADEEQVYWIVEGRRAFVRKQAKDPLCVRIYKD